MMGRMPRSCAVTVVFDVSMLIFFYDFQSCLLGEGKPLAVAACFAHAAMLVICVNLLFQ
jgi:hypothetical protein